MFDDVTQLERTNNKFYPSTFRYIQIQMNIGKKKQVSKIKATLITQQPQ